MFLLQLIKHYTLLNQNCYQILEKSCFILT